MTTRFTHLCPPRLCKQSGFFLTTLFLLFYSSLHAQASADESGILHQSVAGAEEFNLICIKPDNALGSDAPSLVTAEFKKYKGVKSIDFNADNTYLYVKYDNSISANQLLAILDKLNIRAHYMVAGVPVYYQKDESVYFIR